ncbi:hypothetical protein [Sphingobacterium pedocola]|nr:hypothetical protein [Sphingobacterium pedocola]
MKNDFIQRKLVVKTVIYSWVMLCSVIIQSCDPETKKINRVMTLAGANGRELQKALDYYAGDKEKSEAAKYVIENIVGHQHVDDLSYQAYVRKLKQMDNPISTDSLNNLWKGSSISYAVDAQTITGDYLIQDLEAAFRIRTLVPWGSSISLQTFKEYVLPYKVSNEALAPGWRTELYERYKHLVIGINDPKVAYVKVLRYLKEITREANSNFGYTIDPLTMDHIKRGSCSQLCVYYAAVLRAFSLPVAYDYIDGWGNYSQSGHSWISFVDNTDNVYTLATRDSVLRERNPIDASTFKEHFDPNSKNFNISSAKTVYKVYRNTYQLVEQKGLSIGNTNFGHKLDVSERYGLLGSVKLEAKGSDYVTLSVFKTGDDWKEFVISKVNQNRSSFEHLGVNVVYLPSYYSNGKLRNIGTPFYIDSDNNVVYVKAHKKKLQNIVLRRKYPLFGNWTAQWNRMIGGEIQVSDNAKFDKPKRIHIIESIPIGRLGFKLEKPSEIKYIRYVCPPECRTPIAEFNLHDLNANKIVVESAIGQDVDKDQLHFAFDGNDLTSAATKREKFWIGAKLKKNEGILIDSIEIIPKHDGNFIQENDIYELYYFDGSWISLGTRTAKDRVLIYSDVPEGALFVLRNKSRGKEERIFTYDDGKQLWW